jgi:alkylation response protein AidB-like acyl-CoA dehydrogenase
MAIDLSFSPEQEMLRDAVRGLCERHAPTTVVRELEDDPVGYPPALWAQLAALDLAGLLLPGEHGGSDMSMLDGAVVYEELGRALAPTPHFVSSVMAGGVLARAGTAQQQAAWLPRIASGSSILSVGWLEPGGGFSPRGVQLRAEPDGDHVVLTGTKQHVAFASSAERLVVLARTGDEPEAVDLFLVDPQAEGVTRTQQMTIASDTQHRVDLEAVRVPVADRLGAPGSGWAAWHTAMHDGAILLAAQAIGGAERALELTVQYAKDRKQFDKPLGAFQAISHYLADAQTAVDGARTLVHEAAWARSVGRPVDRLAPMAKLFACDTFRDVTAMAQQVFGGVGFTVEYDIQLYFRRAKQLQISWWDARTCEELIAQAVLDAPAAPAGVGA